MLQGCKAREALAKSGGASLGLWQTFPGANISRTLARADGIDWVMVDCEHGNIDGLDDQAYVMSNQEQKVGFSGSNSERVPGALDAGAHGILIPLLRSAEEARKIVTAAKFPPVGQRGLGSPFAMERFTPIPTMTEYLQSANDSLLTMVQIETKEALEAVEEIAAVPGVDLLFVGPFDLGNNLGMPILDGVMQDGLEEAIERILTVAHAAGKKAAFFATSGAQAKKYADQGFDMISVALDATALQQTMSVSLNSARGLDGPSPGGRY
ncbi:hypothetical protein PG985_007196 [Apiospora marii]|uniref:HpcH/HpaI aldolase/citrate lyase domain-containing protein n=1 Tax=Apiospora marii TaxID=335849 RepID=A0ABR1SER5_9PEZI